MLFPLFIQSVWHRNRINRINRDASDSHCSCSSFSSSFSISLSQLISFAPFTSYRCVRFVFQLMLTLSTLRPESVFTCFFSSSFLSSMNNTLRNAIGYKTMLSNNISGTAHTSHTQCKHTVHIRLTLNNQTRAHNLFIYRKRNLIEMCAYFFFFFFFFTVLRAARQMMIWHFQLFSLPP